MLLTLSLDDRTKSVKDVGERFSLDEHFENTVVAGKDNLTQLSLALLLSILGNVAKHKYCSGDVALRTLDRRRTVVYRALGAVLRDKERVIGVVE
jgi:hypothetical protein